MNLKQVPYNISDKENIIDLINYNFDQLFANSYGAAGPTGSGGALGLVGSVGDIGGVGATGPSGAAGDTGISGNLEWSTGVVAFGDSSIVVPKSTTSHNIKATVLIGSTSTTDIENDDYSLNITGVNASGTSQIFSSNIQLSSPGSSSYFDISLREDVLRLGFDSSGTSNVLKLRTKNGIIFKSSTGADVAKFNDGDTVIYKDIIFRDSVSLGSSTFTDDVGTLHPNRGLTLDSSLGTLSDTFLVKSIDNQGSLQTVDTGTMGTGVKVGTVVPLHHNFFTHLNFERSYEPATQINAGLEDWETQLGKGKTGTDYENWYICHGYTWYNLASNVAFNTPDSALRTFNSDSSTAVLESDTRKRISGGGRSRLYDSTGSSTSHGSGNFSWKKMETSVNPAWIDDSNGSSTSHNEFPFNIVVLHHIIYLGRDDLSWRFTDTENKGNTAATSPAYIEEETTYNWFNAQFTPNVDHGGWLGPGMRATPSPNYHYYSRPTNLYRKYLPSGQNSAKIITSGVGPLYMSPGRMAPTGIYRVTEDPLNQSSAGYYYAQFTWTLETMTFSNVTYSSVQ